jgi:hypothetical protein
MAAQITSASVSGKALRSPKAKANLKAKWFRLNRHFALAHCLSMIFFRKPVSTFRDHALKTAGVAAKALIKPLTKRQ